jgi:alpha-ketoglutarate-dependent taurine dioxygenase
MNLIATGPSSGEVPRSGIPLFSSTSQLSPLRQALLERGIALVMAEPGDAEGRELTLIVAALGQADSHHAAGAELWHVRFDPTVADYRGARSLTTMAFPFHTDGSFEQPPPRYIALYVVQQDRHGGGLTLLLETAAVLNRISPQARQILRSTNFRFRVPPEFDKGTPHRDLPILLDRGLLRYRREIIDESMCTPAQTLAMDELDAAINSAEPVSLPLESGTILLLDNALFLHARTEVFDRERHLLRMRFNMI